MGQKANLLTLKAQNENLSLSNASAIEKTQIENYIKNIKKVFDKKGVTITSYTVNTNQARLVLGLNLFFKTKKLVSMFAAVKTRRRIIWEKKFGINKRGRQVRHSVTKKSFLKIRAKYKKRLDSKNRIIKKKKEKKSFENVLKNMAGTNLFATKVFLVNKHENKEMKKEIRLELRKFRKPLFARRVNLYFDVIKLIDLFMKQRVNISVFCNVIGTVFRYLPKRGHSKFFLFMKEVCKLIRYTSTSQVKGIKFMISGKIKGKLRARSFKISMGSLKASTISAMNDWDKVQVKTLFGTFGINMFVNYKKTALRNLTDNIKDRLQYKKVRISARKKEKKPRRINVLKKAQIGRRYRAKHVLARMKIKKGYRPEIKRIIKKKSSFLLKKTMSSILKRKKSPVEEKSAITDVWKKRTYPILKEKTTFMIKKNIKQLDTEKKTKKVIESIPSFKKGIISANKNKKAPVKNIKTFPNNKKNVISTMVKNKTWPLKEVKTPFLNKKVISTSLENKTLPLKEKKFTPIVKKSPVSAILKNKITPIKGVKIAPIVEKEKISKKLEKDILLVKEKKIPAKKTKTASVVKNDIISTNLENKVTPIVKKNLLSASTKNKAAAVKKEVSLENLKKNVLPVKEKKTPTKKTNTKPVVKKEDISTLVKDKTLPGKKIKATSLVKENVISATIDKNITSVKEIKTPIKRKKTTPLVKEDVVSTIVDKELTFVKEVKTPVKRKKAAPLVKEDVVSTIVKDKDTKTVEKKNKNNKWKK